MNAALPVVALKAKDYATDQEVRWCPGCGDYAILKAMQKTLAEIGAAPEQTVFVSGIGCAARFPYYMETFGFHTIHGRAPAIATGLKIANPDLDVWVISGDGDSLSIGGNHLLHLLRRNVDVQFLLFNNEIYGLTKGQFSPTSRVGTRSPTTPNGSRDNPVHAMSFALGAGAKFVARATDVGLAQLGAVFKRARAFRGTSFVEILQNCIVYNDAIFDPLTDKRTSAAHQVMAEHGQPLRFGVDGEKGIRLDPKRLALEVIEVGEQWRAEDVLVHDETNLALARLLAELGDHQTPTVTGILYCDPDAVPHESSSMRQVAVKHDLDALFRQGITWTVEDTP